MNVRRLLLALLLVLGVTSVVYSQTYTTTFPATANPITEGGNWINGGTVGLDWGNVQTATNKAFGVSLPSQFGDPTAVLTGTWGTNQTVTATVKIAAPSSPVAHEVEIRLRTSITAHSITGYEVLCSVVTASPYIQVIKWNGPVANFTQLDQNGSLFCADGDVLVATVSGPANATQIRLSKNGTFVTFSNCNCTTVTDTTGFTNGSPGIGFYDNQDVNWSNFGFSAFTASAGTAGGTCSQADITAAITAAAAGSTVTVPAGNCTWSTASPVNIAKNITLNGAGQGVTNITLSGSASMDITKQVAGPIRIQNLSFNCSTKVVPHVVTARGPWPTGQPIIFRNITFNMNGCDFMTAFTPGGIIFANFTFNAGVIGDTLYTGKDVNNTGNSWGVASSLGTLDTTGFYNTYIETGVHNGGNVTDCDDGCRAVMRFNTVNESTGFNSHGDDTSSIGMRQFEIYSNHFFYPDKTCPNGALSPSNINQYIWIRGGTGVIYNNDSQSLFSSCWGDKNEWKFAIRGAEDVRPLGISCGATTYPAKHQLGQGSNGTIDILDPIYIWGNTSNDGIDPGINGPVNVGIQNGWQWNNPCNFDWNTFFRWGRDAINTTLGSPTMPFQGGIVEGAFGTAKPGYTAYPYPHPLVGGTATPAISISPNPVPFGTFNVGSPSTPQTITFSNVGTATESYNPLALGGANAGDWARTGGSCTVPGGTVVAGASCTWIGVMTPLVQGPRTATLTMTGTVNASVILNGSGQTTLSIPSVPTGLTATVSGPNVTLNWTASTGTVTGYKISRGTVSGGPYTLIATTTTTAVTYLNSALANGTYYYVVASYNSAGTSANSTQASAVVATASSADLVPASVNFGDITLGLSSAVQTSTLTNTGTATLSSIVVNNPSLPDFTQTNNCGATLAISASCTISMVFTPTAANTEQATLSVTSNDPQGPASIVLNGRGVNPVVLSPPSITLTATYTTKTSATAVLTYTNQSGPTIAVATIAYSGGDFAVFSQTNNCIGNVVNGASCTINITFTPTSNGTKTTTLVITDNANGSPRSIVVTGQAKGHHILKVGVAI